MGDTIGPIKERVKQSYGHRLMAHRQAGVLAQRMPKVQALCMAWAR